MPAQSMRTCYAVLLCSLGFAARRGEQGEQWTLDRGLACRRRDFGAEQVGDVEHIDHPFAEGSDMGRGDVEVELRQCRRQFVEETRPVETGHFDHRMTL